MNEEMMEQETGQQPEPMMADNRRPVLRWVGFIGGKRGQTNDVLASITCLVLLALFTFLVVALIYVLVKYNQASVAQRDWDAANMRPNA